MYGDIVRGKDFALFKAVQILNDLKDADDCFLCGHYRQSAIMFRTALESPIRVNSTI